MRVKSSSKVKGQECWNVFIVEAIFTNVTREVSETSSTAVCRVEVYFCHHKHLQDSYKHSACSYRNKHIKDLCTSMLCIFVVNPWYRVVTYGFLMSMSRRIKPEGMKFAFNYLTWTVRLVAFRSFTDNSHNVGQRLWDLYFFGDASTYCNSTNVGLTPESAIH